MSYIHVCRYENVYLNWQVNLHILMQMIDRRVQLIAEKYTIHMDSGVTHTQGTSKLDSKSQTCLCDLIIRRRVTLFHLANPGRTGTQQPMIMIRHKSTKADLILTVQLKSTLCISYSNMHAGKVHTRKSHITHKIVVIDSSFYDSCIT